MVACEADACSQPSWLAATEPVSARSTATLAQPTAPKRFAPESTPVVTTAEFLEQAGSSDAALLKPTTVDQGEPPPSLRRDRPTTKAPATMRSPLQSAPQPAALTEPPVTATYALTGRDRNLVRSQETELVRGLDQALNLDGGLGDASTPTALVKAAIDRAATPTGGSPGTAPTPTTTSPPIPLNIPVEGSDDFRNDDFPAPTRQPTIPTVTSPPTAAPPAALPIPQTPPPPGTVGVVELNADRQDYNEQQQVFTAEGNVTMRFQGALLDADRVQVNLVNRIAVAEGNVALTRGSQVLRGQRFEYNFVQGSGTILNARGDIFLPSAGTDLATITEDEPGTNSIILSRPVSDRITVNQPTVGVNSPGGFSTSIGAGRDVSRVPGALQRGGTVRRLRFEAKRIDFTPEGWDAQNIDITNDPFSPPEFLLRADRAKLTRLSPLRDEVRASRARLVFDQRFSLPILLSRTVLDRSERQPPIARFGYDFEERGGFFVERPFIILASPSVRFTFTPQIYLQRAFTTSDRLTDPANFGFRTRLDATLTPRTQLRASVSLPSLNFDETGDRLRASLRLRQLVGTHRLGVDYSYRDRLFNGSLGFQTVQSSLGAILISPPTTLLGNTGINLTYQVGYQFINADTDRLDLLEVDRENNRVNLSRFQATAELSRGIVLWRGRSLPPTPTEGLRYTPNPILPYISLSASVRGVFGAYSNSETQQDLVGTVQLFGQFGNFSRPFLDYTAVSVTYTQVFGSGESPFLFDRTVDNRVLTLGFTQQLYGPFRIGFQTSINLDTQDSISTDYILEYSRRTYGIILRYNPTVSIGSLSLRISDFNWTGGTAPFTGADVAPVDSGIRSDGD